MLFANLSLASKGWTLLASGPTSDFNRSEDLMSVVDFSRRYDDHQRLENTTKRYTVTFE